MVVLPECVPATVYVQASGDVAQRVTRSHAVVVGVHVQRAYLVHPRLVLGGPGLTCLAGQCGRGRATRASGQTGLRAADRPGTRALRVQHSTRNLDLLDPRGQIGTGCVLLAVVSAPG